jgi:hypothetical protein
MPQQPLTERLQLLQHAERGDLRERTRSPSRSITRPGKAVALGVHEPIRIRDLRQVQHLLASTRSVARSALHEVVLHVVDDLVREHAQRELGARIVEARADETGLAGPFTCTPTRGQWSAVGLAGIILR